MKFKILILVALVLCLTLCVCNTFAEEVDSVEEPIQSGLLVDSYNWFYDTFFGGDVPPLLASLSEEFSAIFSVFFIGSIIAVPIFLVWVLVKSVVAMSLFNSR